MWIIYVNHMFYFERSLLGNWIQYYGAKKDSVSLNKMTNFFNITFTIHFKMGSSLKQVGNILWWFPGFGFLTAIEFFIFGFILCLTIVMAPYGLGLIEIGKFYLAPFTRSLVHEESLTRKKSSTLWRTLSIIFFIIYLPLGLFLCACLILNIIANCITIIGIPFAIPAVKSLGALFNPVGQVMVSDEVKEAIERKETKRQLRQLELSSSTSSAYSSRSPSPVPHRHHHDHKSKSDSHKKHWLLIVNPFIFI